MLDMVGIWEVFGKQKLREAEWMDDAVRAAVCVLVL